MEHHCLFIKEVTCQTSDASGSWGCRTWHEDEWFQIERDQNTRELHIAATVFIPILIAAFIWGPKWESQRVNAYCDNMAVVAAVKSRYYQDSTLMQKLRGLFFIEAHYQFKITVTHIPGQHTIKTYLAGVCHMQVTLGLPEPRAYSSLPHLCLVQAGIYSQQMPAPTRVKLPITPALLLAMRALWHPIADNPDIVMLWAASVLCFFGFFRAGEITFPSSKAVD